jgi:hypothetical protein
MKKIILITLAVALVTAGCIQKTASNVMEPEAAKAKIVDFINTNLMKPGSQVSIKEFTEANGLYRVVVNTSAGDEIESYLTIDGEKFFPQVIDIAETEQQLSEQKSTQAGTAADVPKADLATVELFVMSHCPYGTQIEKGILPVLETLGDKVDFELKFCDYAMHPTQGEVEEQLNQYCIQKEEPNKFTSYLKCFLEAGNGAECLTKTSINRSKLNTCVTQTDNEYKVTELLEDKSTWKSGRFPQFNIYQADALKYGVTGSPGLVVNGKKISSGRDSASLLKTICAGFSEQPEECFTELSSAAPGPGFGFGSTGSDSQAGCGS